MNSASRNTAPGIGLLNATAISYNTTNAPITSAICWMNKVASAPISVRYLKSLSFSTSSPNQLIVGKEFVANCEVDLEPSMPHDYEVTFTFDTLMIAKWTMKCKCFWRDSGY